MLTVVSDTHSTDGHRLRGRTLAAVREAELVIHAGDFYREPVLDAFYQEAEHLRAVYGNNADSALRERLPETRIVEHAGVRFLVTHRHRSGDTGLVMLARERGADAVICGHTHAPRFDDEPPVPILNPGSHAQPRGTRPAHAELESAAGGLDGRLVTPDGEVFREFRIEA
ncbi:metallophosphoesterase [Halorubrum gandharaense]